MRREVHHPARLAYSFQFTHPGKGATSPIKFALIPSIGFNSRTLGRVRLKHGDFIVFILRFNSRTLGRVRHRPRDHRRVTNQVSIHAPWEGCDVALLRHVTPASGFNSRTLGRVRHSDCVRSRRRSWFQFTHPGKGATLLRSFPLRLSMFQFTHPGKGATDKERILNRLQRVSIHAPWEGCDYLRQYLIATILVSIHAPWEGCDD